MTTELWQQVKQILGDALERPPEARPAFLTSACKGDDRLRHEVDMLLDAYQQAEAENALGTALFDRRLVQEALADVDDEDAGTSGQAGQRVGPYRLVEEIGRGGMGSVYRAERDDGLFEQEVAVKLVRRGLESLTLQRRFEQERQILAHLRHEGIARLFDGGVTGEGQPYLVMEYIEGLPLTEYANRYRLSTEQRISLFRDVCAAVHYAHQNLVIHRDLKPGNILVTDVGRAPGGDPRVKLLDFGIARLIESEGAGALPLTRTGMRVMTFEYAAPEQIRGEPVTTATDVYALGILLYELLTGQRPYDVSGLSPSEIERVICTAKPERPSTAVTRPDEAEQPLTPRRRLRGDLDNIVLKALRKEPKRRYTSVAELSDDLRRYLAKLPVKARTDTVGYRTAKFARRHRWGVAAALLLFLSLVSGLAATAWQAQQAMQERDRAQAEAAKAERINQFLQDMLTSANPYGEGERDVTVLEVLQRASLQLDTALADQPDVRAAALTSLGTTYLGLGRLSEAEGHLREALALRQSVLGPDHPDVGETTTQLANTLRDQGRYAEADSLLRRVIAINMAHVGELHEDYATALSDLATLLVTEGDEQRLAEAESLQRRALAIDEELFGETHQKVAVDLGNLATLRGLRGDDEEAELFYRRALAINREVFGEGHPTTLTDLNNLAVVLAQAGRLAEAESMLREVLALRRRSLGEAHPHVANTLLLLGQIQQMQDDNAEAAVFYQDALAILEQLLPEDHRQRVSAQEMLEKAQAAQ